MKRFYHKSLIFPAALFLNSGLYAQVTSPARPALLELRLPADGVDITSSGGLVYMEAKFKSATPITQIRGRFVSSDGKSSFNFGEAGYPLAYHLTGGPLEGSLRIPVRVPSQLEPGDWRPTVYLSNARSTSEYGGEDGAAFPEGSQPGLRLINSGPVNTLPVLTAVQVDGGGAVDVTDSARTVEWTFTLRDDQGVDALSFNLEREPEPDDSFYPAGLPSGVAERTGGTAQEGTWRARVEFPRSLMPGTYRITTARARETGRPESVPFTLLEGGWDTVRVINTGVAETALPVLTALRSSRQSVNVTHEDQTVEVTVTLGNLRSGARNGSLGLTWAEGAARVAQAFTVDPASISVDGRATVIIPVTIPRHIRPGSGEFTVSIQNSVEFGGYGPQTAQPPPEGSDLSLEIVDDSPLPVQAPEMTSFSFTPSRLDQAAMPGLIRFSARLRSASGVTSAGAYLVVSGNASMGARLELVEGTPQDGLWTGVSLLDGSREPGEYFTWLQVRDTVGNRVEFGAAPAAPRGDLRYPEGWPAPLLVRPGGTAVDAYGTWRQAFPGLEGTAGDGQADPDGDGFPNAVEFLCGTDPLRSTLPGGSDPGRNRLLWNPDRLRMESTPPEYGDNTRLGSGTSLRLKAWKSATLLPDSWRSVEGVSAGEGSKTVYYPLDVPGTAGPAQFLRLGAGTE